MEIELIARPFFDLKIGDAVFKDFTVLSEWEGFKKLSSRTHGTVIVATQHEGDFAKLFDNFFALEKTAKNKAVLIKGPTDILAAASRELARQAAEPAKGGAA